MSGGPVWHEDDVFWRAMYPLFFGPKQWAEAPREAEQVLALLGLPRGVAVLDLCCGPGRHSLELARRGFRVTGVDRTAEYLEEATRRAEEEGLSVEFVRDDMRLFCRPEAFEGAINLSTSFGYFESPDDDRRVLRNLYRSLKDAGILVIEMMGKETVARDFRETESYPAGNGATVVEDRRVSRDGTWFEKKRRIVRDARDARDARNGDGQVQDEFKVSHRLYSAAELSALLKACGFRSVKIFGDLAGAPYDHEAKALVAVALKQH